jgi:hypothetical protein
MFTGFCAKPLGLAKYLLKISQGRYNVVKKGLVLSCLAVMAMVAQEKTAYNKPVTSTWVKYLPAEVKVLGVLDYGHAQSALDHTASPRYRAFVFSGHGRDRVEITLTGATSASSFTITDSTLNQIGTGSSRVTVSLPYRGPDIEVYYIVFPATSSKTSNVTVQVRKVGMDMSPPKLITEIKGATPESTKQGGFE